MVTGVTWISISALRAEIITTQPLTLYELPEHGENKRDSGNVTQHVAQLGRFLRRSVALWPQNGPAIQPRERLRTAAQTPPLRTSRRR